MRAECVEAEGTDGEHGVVRSHRISRCVYRRASSARGCRLSIMLVPRLGFGVIYTCRGSKRPLKVYKSDVPEDENLTFSLYCSCAPGK
eukprot:3285517-Prymnesium_polylepis.1